MTEFEISDKDLQELMRAAQSAPMVALQCGMPSTSQERVNAAWERLGEKMGFDHTTVRPSRHNKPHFFWAKRRAALTGGQP